MHYHYRNVNDAFRGLVKAFANSEDQSVEIRQVLTRNGPVLQIMEPTIITYERPTERVLFNQARDCNPFFHLYESLWMLVGRNDVAPLDYYLGGRYSQFSDDTKTANGAYGYRWRKADPHLHWKTSSEQETQYTDQLAVIVEHLKKKPEDRRCVLQMWNVQDDLLKMGTSKDVCCNLCALFLLRDDPVYDDPNVSDQDFGERRFLDMTVMNRSNDLANGMLGANVVHFSFLQEYVAARLGVEVGVYNQVSNNLHIYTESFGGFPAEKWLADKTPNYYGFADNDPKETPLTLTMVPLVQDPATFDRELPLIVQAFSSGDSDSHTRAVYSEPFFETVAKPMLWAFRMHKSREYDYALKSIKEVKADDWRIAGRNWILKRQKNWEAKKDATASAQQS